MQNAGSIWRKWDLQVQTRLDANYSCLGPNSLSEDQLNLLIEKTKLDRTEITSKEKDIDAIKYAKLFVGYITLFTDLEAVVVTDHNTGAELDYLIAEAQATGGKLTILPGVEVCSNQGIHILCIFDPKRNNKSTWKDFIDHFLTEINLTGPRFDDRGRPAHADLSAQKIMEKVEEKGGLCVFAHIATDNGLFKQSATANGGTAHINIYLHPLCQIVQVPSGILSVKVQRIINGEDDNYGKKIVAKIRCSDSRKLTDVGKLFTWIKGDSTFEGLKQITFEPTERVKLQENKPETKSTYHVIESFRIVDSHRRFGSEAIPLNRNLVAITGGKSTGKSLLLCHLARAADLEEVDRRRKDINEEQHDPYEKFSDLDIEVKWADGKVTSISEQILVVDKSERKVTYIPQGYLNHISDKEFPVVDEVVEKLLLQKDEAKIYLQEHQSEVKQVKATIAAKIVELFTYKNDIEKLHENLKLTGTEEGIRSYIDKLNIEITAMSEKYGFTAEETEQRVALEQQFVDYQDREKAFETDRQIINRMSNSIDGLVSFSELEELANEISDESLSNVSDDIAKIKQQAFNSIAKVVSAATQKLILRRSELCKQRFAIGRPLVKLKQKAGKQSELEERNGTLNTEKEKLKKVLRLKQQVTDKRKEYKATKDNLIELYRELHAAYTKLKDQLAVFDHELSDIDLSVNLVYDEDRFAKEFHSPYVDGRKSKLEDINTAYDQDNPEQHIIKLEENLDAILKQKITLKGNADAQKAMVALLENRFRLNFGITYKNDDFNRMSPGKKGLVLLKMLVELDNSSHPILIDQPEDDLDNRSIYHDLATFLRDKKKHRQIIIVTHNPNLVVGTDAEQVIVCNQDGQDEQRGNREFPFEFVAGAIENSFEDETASGILFQKGIREHICEILEGGREAFRKREERYDLNASIMKNGVKT